MVFQMQVLSSDMAQSHGLQVISARNAYFFFW